MALISHPLVGDAKYTFGYVAQRRAAGYEMPQQLHEQSAGRIRSSSSGESRPAFTTFHHPRGPTADVTRLVASAATRCLQPPISLWALRLSLGHPVGGGQLQFEIEEPAGYETLLAALSGEGSGDGVEQLDAAGRDNETTEN